jgi:hypothetical protein
MLPQMRRSRSHRALWPLASCDSIYSASSISQSIYSREKASIRYSVSCLVCSCHFEWSNERNREILLRHCEKRSNPVFLFSFHNWKETKGSYLVCSFWNLYSSCFLEFQTREHSKFSRKLRWQIRKNHKKKKQTGTVRRYTKQRSKKVNQKINQTSLFFIFSIEENKKSPYFRGFLYTFCVQTTS